jgi:hypothetical protein
VDARERLAGIDTQIEVATQTSGELIVIAGATEADSDIDLP